MSRRVINVKMHEAEQKAHRAEPVQTFKKNKRKKAVKNEQHTSAAKSKDTRRSA